MIAADAAGNSRTEIRPLLPVLLTVLLDLLGFGLVIPLLAEYGETFGASPVQVTLLMASYSVAQFFAAPLWGLMSDRIGRRPVMLVSIAGTALALAAFALSTSLPWLFLFRTFNGAFAANISTAQAYVADMTTPQNRAKGMGFIGAAFGIGFTLGPWFGGELSTFGLTVPIWAASLLSSLNLVWAYAALPESRPVARSGRTVSPRVLSSALTHPAVGLAIVITFSATFAFSMMEATFNLVAKHVWLLGPMHIGRMFLLIGVIGVIVQGGLIGRLAKRFGEDRLVTTGLVLNGLGLAALALAATGEASNVAARSMGIALGGLHVLTDWIGCKACAVGTSPASPATTAALAWLAGMADGASRWVGCGFLALGTSLANPSLNSMISNGVGPDEQGSVLGTNQSLSALARAMAPTVGGILYERWFRGGAFLAGAMMVALMVPLAIPAVRRAKLRQVE